MSGYLTCWLLPVPVRMDWLHCNQCYRREGIAFVVASCGHIVCESCVNPSKFLGLSSTEQCTVCGTSCNYLHISDKMKPQEQAYFSDPVKLMHSRLEHISQVALFQNRQKEKITAYFKQKSVDLEKRLKEVKEQSYRYSAFASVLLWEVSELRRENAELKKPLSQRRVSVGNFQTSSSNRMSRPVAITPPVTPGLRLPSTICTGSGMSIERYRDQHSGIMTGLPSAPLEQLTEQILQLQTSSGSELAQPSYPLSQETTSTLAQHGYRTRRPGKGTMAGSIKPEDPHRHTHTTSLGPASPYFHTCEQFIYVKTWCPLRFHKCTEVNGDDSFMKV
ncbi:RING finger protein 212B-like isoform X4 [Brienomyrus brachyistius]|uniref:RING finger protein 212B-like isoform X4 n=1 Tax=Brienomyrus brachyistius TaxID=42636 RepID=UPI0020B3EC14|nr:RING finger protein 212B-like isoform X4 [Brienomyrus brachyistius]